MDTNSKRQKRREGALSALNVAIEAANLAKEVSSMTPAKAVFGSVSVLLAMIRDSMANETDYVDLGLACVNVCKAFDRGIDGKNLDDLSRSVCEAIALLMRIVTEIQEKIVEKGERNLLSRLVHARNDKEIITSWRSDLNSILHVFNTELIVNTHLTVSDIRIGGPVRSVQTSSEPSGSRLPLSRLWSYPRSEIE